MIDTDLLDGFVEAVNGVVGSGKERASVRISELAKKDPGEPAFQLALAMLAGFSNDFYAAQGDVARHLDAAEADLSEKRVEMTEMNDPHLRFADAMLTVLRIQSQMIAMRDKAALALREMRRSSQAIREEKEFFATLLAMLEALNMMGLTTTSKRGRTELEKLIDSDAIGDFASFALTYAYRQDGEPDRAQEVAERLSRKHPRSVVVHELLGSIAAQRGDRDAAVEHYRNAVEAAPNSIGALIGLSFALSRAGDNDAGRESAEKAIALDKTGRYHPYTSNALLQSTARQ
ncbi:Tetratricopeptide repeat-containing protein [Roseivivax lentus]|uniref:Tetratricopeptide repeat-containing protein n=1 Tax=Roseivivax lentus TaxID=633194 RepID=A0A1N7NZ90_9RHOB|nr:tetratricopeptide repeat protein [Roseivivax lentus]SIT03529.1 Tetratricopeptide repeat-containing protein [Roseivivax lentus]